VAHGGDVRPGAGRVLEVLRQVDADYGKLDGSVSLGARRRRRIHRC